MPKAKSASYPENWPTTPSIPYLSVPVIAADLSKDILSSSSVVGSPSLEAHCVTIATPTVPYTNIRITPITDPSHPARGQCGLFTTQGHPPDGFVCLYLGMVHSTGSADLPNADNAEPKSDYDLSLDRDLGLAVDAAHMGNEARFINDYRGIADRPNAEFRDVLIKPKVKGGKIERGVGVFVKTAKMNKKGKASKADAVGIVKGEEILVSYGRGFWSARRIEAEV